jgi:hypothetical protein
MTPVRRLLLPAVALLLAAAPAAQAATSATGNSSVTANIASTLEATFPGNYAFGGLAAGNNVSTEQVTTVKSNTSWGLKVATDLADGRMAEWAAVAYVPAIGRKLTNPLEWSLSSVGGAAQSSAWNAFSSTPASVVTSQAATDNTGSTVGVTYRQNVSYADQDASPNTYRIQVAYTAQQGF